MGKLLAMRGRDWGGLQVLFYRLASHFFPFLVLSQMRMAMPTIRAMTSNKPTASMLFYSKLLRSSQWRPFGVRNHIRAARHGMPI